MPEIDESCHIHPRKIVEVYCLDHKKICCSVCFATEHRHCKDVKSINTCAEDPTRSVFGSVMQQKLKELTLLLDEDISDAKTRIRTLNESKETASAKMKVLVETAKKNLCMLHEKFESDLETELAKDTSLLEQVLGVLRGIKASVICDHQILLALETNGTKTQKFLSQEKMKIQLAEQHRLASKMRSSCAAVAYNIDSKALEEICKLDQIGLVKGIVNKPPLISHSLIRKLSDLQFSPQKPADLKWSEKWEYRLHAHCYGATFLGQDLAFVTNEHCVVILHSDGKEKAKFDIPYPKAPADINATDIDNEVNISFCNHDIVKKYSVSSSGLTEVGEIRLKHPVEGFCFMENKIVHASESNIYVSSITEDSIQTIPACSPGNIGFIAGVSSRRMFYHTDVKELCCRDLHGNLRNKVSLASFTSYPRDMGVDFQGNVYVCCYEENKLLQLSHIDYSIREISGIVNYTISFHPNGRSFVVIDIKGRAKFYKLQE